jgi:hypothetical protein
VVATNGAWALALALELFSGAVASWRGLLHLLQGAVRWGSCAAAQLHQRSRRRRRNHWTGVDETPYSLLYLLCAFLFFSFCSDSLTPDTYYCHAFFVYPNPSVVQVSTTSRQHGEAPRKWLELSRDAAQPC